MLACVSCHISTLLNHTGTASHRNISQHPLPIPSSTPRSFLNGSHFVHKAKSETVPQYFLRLSSSHVIPPSNAYAITQSCSTACPSQFIVRAIHCCPPFFSVLVVWWPRLGIDKVTQYVSQCVNLRYQPAPLALAVAAFWISAAAFFRHWFAHCGTST